MLILVEKLRFPFVWTVEFGEEVSEVQEGRRERAGYGGDSVGGRESEWRKTMMSPPLFQIR